MSLIDDICDENEFEEKAEVAIAAQVRSDKHKPDDGFSAFHVNGVRIVGLTLTPGTADGVFVPVTAKGSATVNGFYSSEGHEKEPHPREFDFEVDLDVTLPDDTISSEIKQIIQAVEIAISDSIEYESDEEDPEDPEDPDSE